MLLNLNLSAQPGSIQWENNYGGSDLDVAGSIQKTNDGGYIVAGASLSDNGDVSGNNGNIDSWLVKLDASGMIQWEGNYGGSSDDAAQSIQQTDDGGYIIAGSSNSNDGNVSGNNGDRDFWVVKVDSAGNIEWEDNYGGSSDDIPRSIQQTDDGGYIVAGSSESDDGDVSGNNGDDDYWLVKVDSNGNIEWEDNYGGSFGETVWSVQQTADGGYILAGQSESDDGDVSGNNGLEDYWVIKVDGIGNIEWENNYGGSGEDVAYSVQQTNDGGYILAGDLFFGNNEVAEYWLVKVDSTGNIEWEDNYGGSDDEVARSVQQTEDGGYIVAGWSQSDDGLVSGNNGDLDYWVIKVDSTGNIEWENNYGGSSSDRAESVQQTTDGGYIVAGFSQSDDGNVTGNNGNNDFWVMKLNGNLSTDNPNSDGDLQSSLYPNPTSNNITVEAKGAKAPLKVMLRDITGRSVSEHKIENPSSFQIEIAQEAGIYMLELKDAAGRKTTRKVIKK